jgi:hypothetical protein
MDPVRFSRLKLMAASPAHYQAAAVETTRCMELGSATDALILGTCPVIAYPGATRRGKEWEAFRDAPENADSLIITKSELAEAEAMRASVLANPRALKVLQGERQKEIHWSYCGRDCVSHLDVLGPKGAFVTELKTSQTSNPMRFRWQALKMLYHAQHAFYDGAAASIYGDNPRRAHFIVCVESSAPYVVTVFRLTPKALKLGQKCCRMWMERLLQCEQADFWPGYSQTVVPLDGPDDEWLESEGVPF